MPKVKRGRAPVQTHALRAARWAVLTPCCGTRWKQRPFEDVLKQLRWLWRRQLQGLADVGLHWIDPQRIGADTKLARKIDCPAFGIRSRTTKQVCNQPRLCPFCYGRKYVLKAMRGLEAAMRCPEVRATKTVVVDYTMTISFTSTAKDFHWQALADERAEVWERIKCTREDGKGRDAKYLDHFGGYVLDRVHFDNNEWKLLRSGVFLCPYSTYKLRGMAAAACEDPRVDAAVLNIENLTRAVGRAFRYPENNLTTVPEIVREYVEHFHGKRAIEGYGLVTKRGSNKRN